MNVKIILNIFQQQKIEEHTFLWIFRDFGDNLGFDYKESEHSLLRGKDFMKKTCTFLREYRKNIIDFG